MALWPGFAPLLADNLALRLISRSADPRVVLVAHGSKTPGASAVSARKVAAQMQTRYGQVDVGFLEEAPFARDVIARTRPPYSLIGLFLGEGLHGAGDFDELVASAPHPPVAAFTAGELPGLARLIADEAQQRLAALARA
jgi:sirohydrochlorin ferrochelatase